MAYTDGVHLIADSIEELHAFAEQMGIKRCWYSNKRGKCQPHYDFPCMGMRRRDVYNEYFSERCESAGCKRVTGKQVVVILTLLYGEGVQEII